MKLLQAFKAECTGHLPALCFLADTLEKCQHLVENKLPEEETNPLLNLIEATKTPLMSKDALMKLHCMKQEFRYSKDVELLMTPLEVLQVRQAARFSLWPPYLGRLVERRKISMSCHRTPSGPSRARACTLLAFVSL